MNAKLYQSRFSATKSDVLKNRSGFTIPYRHKTTANFGKLVPFYCMEVLPGDTFNVNTQMLARMSTPMYPVMDNAYIDYYYFFVPNRLVWSHWAEFLGENKLSAWVSDVEYTIPHSKFRAIPGQLFDHFGIPTADSSPNLDINVLPMRAYQLIWNEWFRDQNTTDPVLVNTGDSVTSQEQNNLDKLLPCAKYFDYFTSCLPAPQKGDTVDIPLGDWAPVYSREDSVPGFHETNLRLLMEAGNTSEDTIYRNLTMQIPGNSDVGYLQTDDTSAGRPDDNVFGPDNLWANLSDVSAVSVNTLRQAFQMQRLLELQARTGTRLVEIIKASFGVVSPDARMQRPEYLGGSRIDVQMQQVAQTSSSDSTSPLGATGAYSKTISAHKDFNQSFTEHGYVIGVMCARTAHTYQQGLARMWSRRNRFDFYWPTFAHIGEQPVLVKEIYATGDASDDEPFGYQEAWAEYRFKPNEVTGAFRSTVSANLDPWHYADYYESRPYLSADWIAETDVNVARTLATSSELADQLIFDIFVHNEASRVMPLYSIPGLIDHF